MTSDPFSSARYSVKHAKRHIEDVERQIRGFHASNPYRHVVEPNVAMRFKSHKIKLVNDLPESLAGTVFDAANCLRSSLDQIGFAVAVAVGKDGRHAHFPFGDEDRSSAVSRLTTRCSDLPFEVQETMLSFKPYKRGNRLLWAINELANTNKHETIVQPTPTPGFAIIRGKRYEGIEPAGFLQWDRAKNEMEIWRTPVDSADIVQFHGAFDLAFADVEGIPGRPVLDTLARMLRIADDCVERVASVALKFGFVA